MVFSTQVLLRVMLRRLADEDLAREMTRGTSRQDPSSAKPPQDDA
jgi:hypothetical protein